MWIRAGRAGAALTAMIAAVAGVGLVSAAPASAAGWQTVASWNGGRTMACAQGNGDGTSTVKVYWDGRQYPQFRDGAEFVNRGGGGLANVSSRFAISNWTYSFAHGGHVGPTVSLPRPNDGWVYLLAGSAVGITVEAVVPVSTLPTCPGASRVAARASAAQGASAERSARACVTPREQKHLKKRLTVGKVRRLVGTKGKAVTTAEYSLVRRYARCGGGTVVVNFKKAKKRQPVRLVSHYAKG